MKLLFLASLSQSFGAVPEDPLKYWIRGQDDSEYARYHRGPLGTNKLDGDVDGNTWDPTHMIDPNGDASSSMWSWLQPLSVVNPGEEPSGSNFYIHQYMVNGINGLHEENSAGKLLSL